MNRLLAADQDVQAETAKLDRRYVLAFELAAGEVTPDQQPVTPKGDLELMTKVGAVFAAGQRAATIESEFPDL